MTRKKFVLKKGGVRSLRPRTVKEVKMTETSSVKKNSASRTLKKPKITVSKKDLLPSAKKSIKISQKSKKINTLTKLAEEAIKENKYTISYIKDAQRELNSIFYSSKFNSKNKKYTGQAILESDLEELQERLHDSVLKLQSNSQLKKDINYCKLRENEVNNIFTLYDTFLNKGRDIYTKYSQSHPKVDDDMDALTKAFQQTNTNQ